MHSFEPQRILSSSPVSGESRPRHFHPCDILPIPKVSQTWPRIQRPNKQLQEATNLTSEPELKKIKKANEAKQLKKQKQEEAARKRAMECAIPLIIIYNYVYSQ